MNMLNSRSDAVTKHPAVGRVDGAAEFHVAGMQCTRLILRDLVLWHRYINNRINCCLAISKEFPIYYRLIAIECTAFNLFQLTWMLRDRFQCHFCQ